ncbi:MAG TPA: discoidin domain-containing protein [Candidatus Binatia bacterium]|jgi:hypothetical protein
MAHVSLDDFTDLSGWLPVASGLARLTLANDVGPRGKAMRLDFDFAGGGGFVVARKAMSLTLPESWALSFDLRGVGPANRLELKLSDPTGRNVWWYHEDAFALPAEWRSMRIRSSQIEFAWGPAGGGPLTHVGAVELALAAGPGGRGSVWLADLRLENLSAGSAPIISASSALPGHGADGILVPSPPNSWRSEPARPQWVQIDFQVGHEFSGVVVRWEPEGRGRAFAVETSNDGLAWQTAYTTADADAARSYVYMPNASARYLRLDLRESVGGRGFGIEAIEVRPTNSRAPLKPTGRDVAADAPRGAYPRYLVGEQSYWTPVGVADGETCALINEEGMVEVDRGTFSIEPFLFVDGRLVTWADVVVSQELEHGYLPIPSSVWRKEGLALRTTAFASRCGGRAILFVRYRVESATPLRATLFTAVRPFQVTPSWQAFGELGGVSLIHELDASTTHMRVNATRSVIPLVAADGAGVTAFDQGGITEHLRSGALPPRTKVTDARGYGSGALQFDCDLAPSSPRDVYLAIPFGVSPADATDALPAGTSGSDELRAAVRQWQEKLGRVAIDVAPRWQHGVDTMRTAAAHVLVNRDGPALQPGPRRYTRAWIRDGAIMAAALLRVGCGAEARQFVRWYAGYQAVDGTVPCVVDRSGPDWLVEHDSHGELIFAIAECVRFTADRAFLDEMWPAAERAVRHLEALRATRLGPAFDSEEKRAFRGLLPESASHEGYLAHHVHAYWDDFWAVRALGDAAYLAGVRGDDALAARLLAARDDFRASVRASIATTIAARAIDYVPGSVEWADFDPTATANAVSLLGETALMPPAALARTFAEYLAGFRRRTHDEIDWANYTPYEVRIVGALVHLGERAAANELVEFLLGDQRPTAWNQWPEISWRDPRSPGHIGDVPHAWIGAEYVLAFRSMLAYEREADQALVVAAGVGEAWLDDGGEVVVDDLPTYWGTFGFTLRRAGADALRLSLRGTLAVPPGGLVLRPPLGRPLAGVLVDGVAVDAFVPDGVTVHVCPAEVVLRL